MDPFELPRQAMDAFETATRMHVTVHVRDMRIWSMLPPGKQSHVTPVCQAAKLLAESRCMALDQQMVRDELERRSEGFVKICHAGLVEWVAPVVGVDAVRRVRLILFAGQGRAGKDLGQAQPFQDSQVRSDALAKGQLAALPVIDAGQASVILELLRQLAARLEQWLGRIEGMAHLSADRLGPNDRRRWIETYIQSHHTRQVTIEDVARGLGVSPGRAAHVVTQACGRSFNSLLTDARVRTAATLLTHTRLSVLEVALRSGFGDVSNFHRRFRERLSVTPLAYRRQARTLTPLTISV